MNEPSRFLRDIPEDLTQGISAGMSHRRERQRYQDEITWPDEVDERPARGKVIPFASAPALQFNSGIRVYHAKFGEGIVIESRRSGQDEEVTVAFEQHGIKRLAASFANLVIMKE
jgi:DNA helicase-2/ATP-dependent DNA helicase PcrA